MLKQAVLCTALMGSSIAGIATAQLRYANGRLHACFCRARSTGSYNSPHSSAGADLGLDYSQL